MYNALFNKSALDIYENSVIYFGTKKFKCLIELKIIVYFIKNKLFLISFEEKFLFINKCINV